MKETEKPVVESGGAAELQAVLGELRDSLQALRQEVREMRAAREQKPVELQKAAPVPPEASTSPSPVAATPPQLSAREKAALVRRAIARMGREMYWKLGVEAGYLGPGETPPEMMQEEKDEEKPEFSDEQLPGYEYSDILGCWVRPNIFGDEE